MRKTKRTIPPDLLEKWNALFRKGDGKLMGAEFGVSPELISIAMKQGQATPELTLKISEFYAKRVADGETPDALIEKAKTILS